MQILRLTITITKKNKNNVLMFILFYSLPTSLLHRKAQIKERGAFGETHWVIITKYYSLTCTTATFRSTVFLEIRDSFHTSLNLWWEFGLTDVLASYLTCLIQQTLINIRTNHVARWLHTNAKDLCTTAMVKGRP